MQKNPECRASAKGIRVEARVLSSLLASCKIYLVQIWSRACFVACLSHIFVYTLHTYYYLALFNIPFALHAGFFCILVLNVSTADISVYGPPPPTGTGSFIKSEGFFYYYYYTESWDSRAVACLPLWLLDGILKNIGLW